MFSGNSMTSPVLLVPRITTSSRILVVHDPASGLFPYQINSPGPPLLLLHLQKMSEAESSDIFGKALFTSAQNPELAAQT